MKTIADIERELGGALHRTRCYLPFTPEFNKIVMEIFPDNAELKQSLAGNDRQHVICLLAQEWETLELALTSENIIQRPLLETFETAYLAVAMEEIYRRCKAVVETRPLAPYWKRCAEWLALAWPFK